MSRSGKIKKRITAPDPLYQSQVITHLINRVMKDGKKTVAQTQIYRALDLIKEKMKTDPAQVLVQALENIKPMLEVRSRRIGGAAYQVPTPVRGERKESLAVRWLIQAAQARTNKEYHHFFEKLAAEILDAQQNQGGAIKKKQDIHRMADANKAFAHFHW